MIPALAIWLAVLVIDLLTDYHQWAKVNHIRGALLRCIGLAIPAVLYLPTLYLLPLYHVLFNGILASMKGLGWFYVGTTARLDRLIRRFPILYLIIYALATVGVILFIEA